MQIGTRIRIDTPLLRRTGIIVHIQPPYCPMSPRLIKKYYGLTCSDEHYRGVSGYIVRVSRVVIEKDGSPGYYVVIPMSPRHTDAMEVLD